MNCATSNFNVQQIPLGPAFSKGEDFSEGVNPSLAKRGRGDLCVQSDAELCAEFLRHRSSESKRDGNR